MTTIIHGKQMTREDGFTLIEVMVVSSIIGILASIALPALVNQTDRSKATEATLGVEGITKNVLLYYDKRGTFPPEGARIPDPPSPGAKNRLGDYVGDFEADPGWREIAFMPAADYYFSYEFRAECGLGGTECQDGHRAWVEARGDLDGDGDTSLYHRELIIESGQVKVGPIFIDRELE